jgi:hypothetical protein
MLMYFVTQGLAAVALVLATAALTLDWERRRVYRIQYREWQRSQQSAAPCVWVRNSPNLPV